ncbi:dethiobiotin synthase [Plebeiibacterium sediminum]|uniref:ATP-dependent dethiobiotin synthetase BioD n=1 Tax=Plebeiibacterium sediminum TaxID=2992112 RepID=A0AAE3SH92_9BACT|nr:dethiobiotin synthase [Plebeiobacterium sediminum]MCW3789330.1 dethiobiotin synthase [Plebeiobacterium sediminum]
MSTYFITAIDTDAGKSVVTGLLAKTLKHKGTDIITMKMAQTGCTQYSEDIETHRKLMGLPLLPEDKNGETCPYLFKFPASPHLSAAMQCERIDEDRIIQAVREIEMQYDTVLLEGVGGLMVPLNEDTMVVDFIQQNDFPVILVTSGKLGSINHTLLSLEVLQKRGINVYGVVYNHYPITEPEITEDSAKTIKKLMKAYYPDALWAEVPYVNLEENETVLDLSEEWFEQG